MIIEPFQVGVFTVTDQQELSTKEQAEVSLAIRDGLNIMPQEYHCEKVRPLFVDAIPIIRFGIHFQAQMIGALWLGCTDLAPGHTERSAQLFVRPCPGFIVEQTARFWKADVFVQIMKYLLNNELQTRARTTVQIVGLDYARDTRIVPREFAQIHTGVNALLTDDPDVIFEKINLPQGGEDIRVKKAPTQSIRRVKR